jgi:hypothetical protein
MRAAEDFAWGTADLTLTVTWLSRICSDTDRIGSRASRRDCTFKSFINPPRIHRVVLFCDTLRRTSGVVKQQPLHLVVKSLPAHYIVRKWLFSIELASGHRTPIRLPFPPQFRWFPTGFPQRFPHLTSAQSPAFPRVFRCHLHSFSTAFFMTSRDLFFSRLFGDFPHLFAGSSAEKSGLSATGA